ncbi:MAG: fibronectin type III domain-containing protein [Coprobacillus sp.]|nr:fibronectin type III domain-containing protein [Coprobacillus sp.]
MNKKNKLIALSVLSAMSLTSVSPLAINSFTNVIALQGDQTVNKGTVVMNQDTTIKYLDTNTDPADGTQAKDKWGQYIGWTRTYKDGDNASLNGQYNDNEWKEQTGEFSTEKGTLNKTSRAYFFRGYFNVDQASAVNGIHLSFNYKDAVIVYINGQQLTALNVPDEGYRSQDSGNGSHKDNMGYGSKETSSSVKTADLYFRDIKDMLTNGQNVIAFEIHKSNEASEGYFKLNELGINPDESLLPERESLKAISLSVGSTPTELNLNWFSTDSTNGQIQFAKKADMTGNEFPEAKAKTVNAKIEKAQADGYYANKATMSDLEENTAYVYRVGNNGHWSETYTTTTKSKGDFSFLFAGDPQLGSSGDLAADKDGWKKTLDLVNTNPLFKDVHFIQNAGDHVEAGKNESQYDAYLSNYQGSVVYSTPFANAVGNHDYAGTAYNDHFNLPNVSNLGSSGQGNAQGDYYYIYNNALMLVLNSNNRSTAEHEEFIKNTLAKTKDNQDIKWKIVVFHHSIYSSASHASDNDILARRDTLAPMFSQNGIDLVLMGHDHVYTRSMLMDGTTALKDESFDQNGNPIHEVTDPKGLTYITANSASGSKYYEFTSNLSGDYIAVKNQEHTPNITKLDVKDNQLKIVTYRTSDLSVVDDFTINKTSTETVDKTELEKLINECSQIDDSTYTKESFAKLQDALVAAKTVLNNNDATNQDVETAYNTLKEAKEQLVKKETNQPVSSITDKKDNTSSTDKKDNPTSSKVKTGDDTPLLALEIASTMAIVAGAIIVIKAKKKEN